MDTIEKLTEVFKEFPGIGERQAKRFVYFLMSRNPAYSENLSLLVKDLKREISQCRDCFRFFIKKDNEKICDICVNPHTDNTTLMVVEKDSDLESVRKSRTYHGRYFVLGGLVPIVEKNTKNMVRIDELVNHIKNQAKSNLEEIILAFSLSPQGDHTDFYVRNQIKNIADTHNIKISSLGRGLSTGTELEYSDNETIKNALKNRQ
ncbi:MAG: toprim domain-containing protein [bacterium]